MLPYDWITESLIDLEIFFILLLHPFFFCWSIYFFSCGLNGNHVFIKRFKNWSELIVLCFYVVSLHIYGSSKNKIISDNLSTSRPLSSDMLWFCTRTAATVVWCETAENIYMARGWSDSWFFNWSSFDDLCYSNNLANNLLIFFLLWCARWKMFKIHSAEKETITVVVVVVIVTADCR